MTGNWKSSLKEKVGKKEGSLEEFFSPWLITCSTNLFKFAKIELVS